MKTKTILLPILFYFILNLSYSQSSQSNITIPQVLFENYQNDVYEISLQRIYNFNSSYKDSIQIPQLYQDSIWNGLEAVYNSIDIPERDSVFNSYCIHCEVPLFFTQKAYISISEECPWYSNWQNLDILTGNSALDELLESYGFELTYFSDILNYGIFVTEQNLNIRPLLEIIEEFDYISYAEPSYEDGSGDQISYIVNENGYEFLFKDGYDDCPSGCQSYWTYHFQIFEDFSAIYLGYTHGEESEFSVRPEPVNCNITLGVTDEIENSSLIFPNPSNGIFNVISPYKNGSDTKVQVFNLTGNKIYSQNILAESLLINISDQPKGIYLLKIIYGDNKILNQKLLIR